jgi:hypothetical protein
MSGFCFLALVVLGTWLVATVVIRWVRSTGRSGQPDLPHLNPRSGPDLGEILRNRPVDEATLRRLDLGPDVERIVRLYRSGRLSRGAVTHRFSVETRVDSTRTVVAFYVRYGWYDALGMFHERSTDQPASGLLNHRFEPTDVEPFLVAWEPSSNDHVIFYAAGGARLDSLPPAPPQPVRRPLPAQVDVTSAQVLLASAHEVFDDDVAMAVLADKLIDAGHPQGALMSMQLMRGRAPASAEETAFLTHRAKEFLPTGVATFEFGFERGFPTEVRWEGPTDPRHAAWLTVKSIVVAPGVHVAPGQTPFTGPLPRLLAMKNASPGVLEFIPRALAQRLETLGLDDSSFELSTSALKQLARMPGLRRLELLQAFEEPHRALSVLLTNRPPRLEEVCLQFRDGMLSVIQGSCATARVQSSPT